VDLPLLTVLLRHRFITNCNVMPVVSNGNIYGCNRRLEPVLLIITITRTFTATDAMWQYRYLHRRQSTVVDYYTTTR
jgi:hypothetical protein